MPPPRWSTVRLLLLGIILLSIFDYLVATVSVQMFEIPVRTDFASYYFAGKLTAAGASPYDAAAIAREGYAVGYTYDQYPFLYPPPFAWLMQPLSRLPFASARAIWMLLSTACLGVALITTLRIVQFLDTRGAPEIPHRVWILMAPFLVMVLNSTGLHNDLRHGSVGAMLWMALALMLHAMLRGRGTTAGLWLAVATLLKLAPILLLPWLAWRAGRRAAVATLVVLAGSMIPALLLWGPSIVVWYVRDALWPAAHLDIAWSNNVSLDALWLRILAPLSAAQANGSWAPVTSAAARLLGQFSDLLLVGISGACLWRSRRSSKHLALELSLLVLLLLLIMRLTWVHTLTSMSFVYPLLMFWGAETAVGNRTRGVTVMMLTSLGFFLAAAHLPVLWGDRWMTWPWLLAPGLHTSGLLCLWGLCVHALWSRDQPPGTIMGRVP